MFGLGFRPRYFSDLVDARPAVDWLELVSENFMGVGGRTRQMLLRLRADYPLALHGVSLSIAGADRLDADHLTRLRELVDEIEPRFVSDHLCWTSWRGRESHDLLPIAYTEAVLAHVAGRVAQVQERLGRRLYLENPTVYVAFADAAMDEAEFLAALCARSGCGVLLDVNNLVVNALNLGVDPRRYLARLEPESVAYLHVAGHAVLPDVRVDTHDAAVSDAVWAVYRAAAARFPGAGTVLERDGRFPEFAELLGELERARAEAAAGRAGEPPAVPERGHDASATWCPPAGTAGISPAEWDSHQKKFFAALTADAPALPLAPTAPVPPARGLRVYRDAYAARLLDGLRANFPALAHVVGDTEFAQLVTAYVARHPPRGYAFNGVGVQLAGFVPTHPFGADFGVAPAVLAELAALEQAELEVHDAPDDGVALPAAALAEIPDAAWPGARVRCVAALRLLRCTHDVLAVVEAVAAGAAPPRPAAGLVDYLIARPRTALLRLRLPAQEASVMVRLLAGATVADACGDADLAVGAAAIARLASCGLLRGVDLS